MTRLQFGLIGAIAGALAVMIFHPATKSITQNGLFVFGTSPLIKSTPEISQNSNVLPDPQTPSLAAWWIHEGCRNLISSNTLTMDQILTLIEISQQSAESEPTNAFWKQAEAVFQQKIGNVQAADEAWVAASKLRNWDDYQISRLHSIINRLDAHTGKMLAWHAVAAQAQKYDETSEAISRYSLIFRKGKSSPLNSYINLVNAHLMQKGTSSLSSGQLASQMMNNAIRRNDTHIAGTTREIIAERQALVKLLAEEKLQDEAVRAREILASTEAFDAATTAVSPFAKRSQYSLLSILTSSLPGGLILTGCLCLLLHQLGRLLVNWKNIPPPDQFLVPALISVALGTLIYLATRLILPATFITFVSTGLIIRPKFELTGAIFELSKPVKVMAVLLSLVIAIGILSLSILHSPSSSSIAYCGGLDLNSYLSSQNILSITLILLGLFAGAIQTWSYSRRRNPYRALGLALQIAFGFTGVTILFFAIVSTPFCIAFDQPLRKVTEQIFTDEPGYYLKQL